MQREQLQSQTTPDASKDPTSSANDLQLAIDSAAAIEDIEQRFETMSDRSDEFDKGSFRIRSASLIGDDFAQYPIPFVGERLQASVESGDEVGSSLASSAGSLEVNSGDRSGDYGSENGNFGEGDISPLTDAAYSNEVNAGAMIEVSTFAAQYQRWNMRETIDWLNSNIDDVLPSGNFKLYSIKTNYREFPRSSRVVELDLGSTANNLFQRYATTPTFQDWERFFGNRDSAASSSKILFLENAQDTYLPIDVVAALNDFKGVAKSEEIAELLNSQYSPSSSSSSSLSDLDSLNLDAQNTVSTSYSHYPTKFDQAKFYLGSRLSIVSASSDILPIDEFVVNDQNMLVSFEKVTQEEPSPYYTLLRYQAGGLLADFLVEPLISTITDNAIGSIRDANYKPIALSTRYAQKFSLPVIAEKLVFWASYSTIKLANFVYSFTHKSQAMSPQAMLLTAKISSDWMIGKAELSIKYSVSVFEYFAIVNLPWANDAVALSSGAYEEEPMLSGFTASVNRILMLETLKVIDQSSVKLIGSSLTSFLENSLEYGVNSLILVTNPMVERLTGNPVADCLDPTLQYCNNALQGSVIEKITGQSLASHLDSIVQFCGEQKTSFVDLVCSYDQNHYIC